MPRAATTAMMPSVFSDDAARSMVRLYGTPSGDSTVETIMFGYSDMPNRNVKAAMVQADDRKAYTGRPCEMARGMLAMARTFSATTTISQGYSRYFAVACGSVSSVAADTTTYRVRKTKNAFHIQRRILRCSSP